MSAREGRLGAALTAGGALRNGKPARLTTFQSAPADDGGRCWETLGEVIGGGGQTRSYLLHLRPRRCRQLRLRLKGAGRCRVYSLSAVYEKGSDGP